MYKIVNLGQPENNPPPDRIEILKKELKECYTAEGDSDRCAAIAKRLRAAIDEINKKEGIQSPGGFMSQVSMQDSYSQQYDNTYPTQYPGQEPSSVAPAPQYSWNQQLPDPMQDYGQQSMLPPQVARNAGLDPMAQNSWNQAMETPQAQEEEPTPEVARRAGLDPKQQYSWNQMVKPEEELMEQGALSPRVARRAGLVPNQQYSWNQSMSGGIPMAGGIGMRALGGPSLGQERGLLETFWSDTKRETGNFFKAFDDKNSFLNYFGNAALQALPMVQNVRGLKLPGLRPGVATPPVKPPVASIPVRPPVATPPVRPPVATPPVRPPVASPRTSAPAPPKGYAKPTPEQERNIIKSGDTTVGWRDPKTGEVYHPEEWLKEYGPPTLPPLPTMRPLRIEQPQSWRPQVTQPSRGPAPMPTKPMTPQGPAMGPPVATPKGTAIYKGTEGAPDVPVRIPMGPENMPPGYGPVPKSVPMPPSVPKWYDPQTGQPYSPIPTMQDYIRQSGEFNTPFPAAGRRNMPPGKPFSKGESEPEYAPVASVDPRTACTGPGQFWDGRQCRGSVSSIPSIPGGIPGSMTAGQLTAASPGVTGMSGRRMSYPVVNM